MYQSPTRVAVVILNYNSEQDTRICAEQIAAQHGVHLSIILVDNASHADSKNELSSWLSAWRADAISGTAEEISQWVKFNRDASERSGNVYFVRNHENKGYSAGNNGGARLAVLLGCEAVLIVNPDVRIEDRDYLLKLYLKLMSDEKYVVAASAIYNLSGANENPMRELKFAEELLLPLRNFFSWLGIRRRFNRTRTGEVCRQVSGSCFLIKSTFLKEIDYFDEGVFLYCEEAILGAQIRNAGKAIAYLPEVKALHAHQAAAKGPRAGRTRAWIKSRGYYLRHHTEYGVFRRALLWLSHRITLTLMRLRDALSI